MSVCLSVCLGSFVTLLYANMGQVYSSSLHNSVRGSIMLVLGFFRTVCWQVGIELPLYVHVDVGIVTPPISLRDVHGSCVEVGIG